MPILEELTKCETCNSCLTEPVSLPCFHVFCKSCVQSKVVAGKLKCDLCDKEHIVPNGNINKVTKQSNLANFLIKYHKDEFDKIKTNEDEEKETDGTCYGCSAPPTDNSKNRNSVEPAIEPILLQISLCFHCQKQLCKTCRTKHYNEIRNEALKHLHQYTEGSENIVKTSEQLNEARENKKISYERLKIDVSERKMNLIHQLDQEELNLIKRLDDEIVLEERNMELSKIKLKRHVGNLEATKSVYQKISKEKDFKRLNELCVEFLQANNEWKSSLTHEASAIDPKKEKVKKKYHKVQFFPTVLKEDIIGTVEQRKGNYKIQSAVIPGSKKSSICTII